MAEAGRGRRNDPEHGLDRIDPLRRLAIGDHISARVTSPHRSSKTPPAYSKLAPWVAPSTDPWAHFTAAETATAGRLESFGVELDSVAELDNVLPQTETERRGPDAVLRGTAVPVELKRLDPEDTSRIGTYAACKKHARKARSQARVVVIDGSDVALSRSDAERAIHGIIGQYGNDLDVVVILYGNGGHAVHWRHA